MRVLARELTACRLAGWRASWWPGRLAAWQRACCVQGSVFLVARTCCFGRAHFQKTPAGSPATMALSPDVDESRCFMIGPKRASLRIRPRRNPSAQLLAVDECHISTRRTETSRLGRRSYPAAATLHFGHQARQAQQAMRGCSSLAWSGSETTLNLSQHHAFLFLQCSRAASRFHQTALGPESATQHAATISISVLTTSSVSTAE